MGWDTRIAGRCCLHANHPDTLHRGGGPFLGVLGAGGHHTCRECLLDVALSQRDPQGTLWNAGPYAAAAAQWFREWQREQRSGQKDEGDQAHEEKA